MDQETVVVQVLAGEATQNGHNSSDESRVPLDSASEGDDAGLQNTQLLRKPLSPITKSYKEKKHQCKQCGAQFSKKLDMHIHRLTHSEADEKGEAIIDHDQTEIKTEAGLDLTVREAIIEHTGPQSEAGLDLTLRKRESQSESKADLDKAQDMEKNEDISHGHLQHDQPIQQSCDPMMTHDKDMLDHSYVSEESNEQFHIDDDHLDNDISELKSTSKDYQDMLSRILSDASQSKYHLDIIVPTPRRTYQCGPCNKRFSDYSLYLQHREDHPNPKLFKCSVCLKGFTIKGNLTRHQQIHEDVRLFECSFCPKKFSQKTHLVTHLGIHTKTAIFCQCCGMTFQTEHSLRAHMVQFHAQDQSLSDMEGVNGKQTSGISGEEILPEQSDFIQKYDNNDSCVVQDINAMVGHSAIDGSTEMLQVGLHNKDTSLERYYRNIHYTCGTCGVVFFDFQTYISHKKEHPTPKLFACEQCGKSFTVKGNLQRHLQIHQDIRLHECDVCHKKFSQKTHLAAHMHVHSKERPYMCTLCGGSFTREGNLRRHIKMHTNAKKETEQQLVKALQIFKCEECFKTFMRKGNLKRHQKLHTR